MSGIVVSHVFRTSRLKGNALLVLVAIADHAKHDGTGAWPSQRLLAEKTKLSVRHVRRLMDVLVASGELHVEERPGKSFLMTIPMTSTPDTVMSGVGQQKEAMDVRGTPDTVMSATPDISDTTPT